MAGLGTTAPEPLPEQRHHQQHRQQQPREPPEPHDWRRRDSAVPTPRAVAAAAAAPPDPIPTLAPDPRGAALSAGLGSLAPPLDPQAQRRGPGAAELGPGRVPGTQARGREERQSENRPGELAGRLQDVRLHRRWGRQDEPEAGRAGEGRLLSRSLAQARAGCCGLEGLV